MSDHQDNVTNTNLTHKVKEAFHLIGSGVCALAMGYGFHDLTTKILDDPSIITLGLATLAGTITGGMVYNITFRSYEFEQNKPENVLRSTLEQTLNEDYATKLGYLDFVTINTDIAEVDVIYFKEGSNVCLDLSVKSYYGNGELGIDGKIFAQKVAEKLSLDLIQDLDKQFSFTAPIETAKKEDIEQSAYNLVCAEKIMKDYLDCKRDDDLTDMEIIKIWKRTYLDNLQE